MDIVGKTIQNGEPTPEHPVDIENKINLTGAIQILNKLKSKVTLVKVDDENNSEKEYRLPFLMNIEQKAIETVLSELEKKDRIIDLMAKEIAFRTGSCPFDIYDYGMNCEKRCKEDIEAECWIKYFTKKVEDK